MIDNLDSRWLKIYITLKLSTVFIDPACLFISIDEFVYIFWHKLYSEMYILKIIQYIFECICVHLFTFFVMFIFYITYSTLKISIHKFNFEIYTLLFNKESKGEYFIQL